MTDQRAHTKYMMTLSATFDAPLIIAGGPCGMTAISSRPARAPAAWMNRVLAIGIGTRTQTGMETEVLQLA